MLSVLNIMNPTFKELQQMIKNKSYVAKDLVDAIITLLRKTRYNVSRDKWEQRLAKFCRTYSAADGENIMRSGFRNMETHVKLRVLKELFEHQFEYNIPFKMHVNQMMAEEQRYQPLLADNARSSRNKGPTSTVPKVVVMGSSTTSNSEATINTSTESASTLVTNVTGTDASETCDSLDLGDTSGQSEPLLSSFDEPATAILINLRQTVNTTDDEQQNLITPGPDTPLLINYEERESKNQKAPRTAPRTAPITSTIHFPFDAPSSPRSVRCFEKNQTLFTFSDTGAYQNASATTTANATITQRGEMKVCKNEDEEKENAKRLDARSRDEIEFREYRMEKTDVSLKNRNHFLNSLKKLPNKEKYTSNSKVNSAPVTGVAKRNRDLDSTMFPFDREAIEYEQMEQKDSESPVYEKPYFDSPSRNYHKFKKDKCPDYPSNSDIYHQYNLISQQESMLSREKETRKSNKFDKRKSDAFTPKQNNDPMMKSVSKFDQIASKFEQIPPKPLDAFHHTVQPELHYTITASAQQSTFTDTSVPNLRIDYFSESKQNETLDPSQKLTHNPGAINVTSNPMDTTVCTHTRATIVVQQASLSLDNTVETFLLKNEGDFISVEQGKENTRKQKREENMRQLLDVTNTLTKEEIRDFEMRYGSPHHCRSQSVKTPGSRASGRPNQLCLPQQRSSTEHLTATNIVNSARTSATCSLASSRESSTSNTGSGPFKVLMLGGTDVGKSSLVSQFMTSEYLHAYDTSIDDDSGEKTISVLLSGEESELVFIDHSSDDMSPENCLSSYNPHGYCVIYSSSDRNSFVIAERIIQALWTSENIAQRAVILVGNKADLARSRVITSEEGKAMATAYDCKFIETSVGINHNVDELLVGLLSQIRLKLENPEKSRDLFRKRSYRKSKRRACSPLGSACLSGNGGTSPSTPVSATVNNMGCKEFDTPPSSAQSRIKFFICIPISRQFFCVYGRKIRFLVSWSCCNFCMHKLKYFGAYLHELRIELCKFISMLISKYFLVFYLILKQKALVSNLLIKFFYNFYFNENVLKGFSVTSSRSCYRVPVSQLDVFIMCIFPDSGFEYAHFRYSFYIEIMKLPETKIDQVHEKTRHRIEKLSGV
ncbi:GTP-binding protein GEM [Pseudolycoriella hygida]|uniref:GTP-binding protein GEM n=1 Tax=Pseudolycoriella hygida TaxID=35572 RepID=A0A9Q0N1V1_9DIPT|nr:GTP-binding protein GEM [Pseudolycoriella hygida]